jgi:carboxyl-terminal processing protease
VQRFYDLGVFAQTSNFELARTLGALKITDQKFYRVNGGSTQLKGVTPDIILPDAYAKIEYGEKKDDYPLRWSQIPAAMHQDWSKSPKTEELLKKSSFRITTDSFFVNVSTLANFIGEKNHDNKYSLNYDKYVSEENEMKNKTKVNERLSKKYRPMYVAIPSTDSIGMIADTNKVSKNNVWRKNIRQDSYIYETGLILIDQILFDDNKK